MLFYFSPACDICQQIKALCEQRVELGDRTVRLVDRPAGEYERDRLVEGADGSLKREAELVPFPPHRRCLPHVETEDREPAFHMTYGEAEAFAAAGPN